jgi:hypothetical protein
MRKKVKEKEMDKEHRELKSYTENTETQQNCKIQYMKIVCQNAHE